MFDICTKTIGVDPSYSQHTTYTKIFNKDEDRIVAKFKDRVTVQKKTLRFEILHHLAHQGPVIILTNALLLRCDICKEGLLGEDGVSTLRFEEILHHLAHQGRKIILTNASLLRCDICKRHSLERMGCSLLNRIGKPRRYAGHYVVLCGFDMTKRKVFIDGHTFVSSMDSMDSARRAFGTDEDVILIFIR